jgi:WD40 repeat protein
MGGASSLDLMTSTIRIWDAETGVAVRKPLEGHSEECAIPSPTPPVGGTSSLDRIDKTIRIWDAETSAGICQASSWKKLQICCPLLPLAMGSTLLLKLIATLPVCRGHFHISHHLLVIHSMLIFIHCLTRRVGSKTQMATYSIGYP